MEFEEMRKIWDTQNNEPIYVLNEQALHNRIISKKNRANWLANINEIGIILIAVATSSYLLIKNFGGENIFAYFPPIALLLTGIYVVFLRIRRRKKANQFERSMLGDLDHAIDTAVYQVNFAKTFFWWFILPVMIPVILNMIMKEASIWKWFMILACIILSYALVRWELNRCHIPRKRSLEALREKLIKEVDINSVT